jgi:hypothetical protein
MSGDGKELERAARTRFCDALDEWAAKVTAQDPANFGVAWRTVRSTISKSCLLDRMLYGGEKPSNTPCPVHKGVWSGCHLGWPGAIWSDGTPVEEDPLLREWYDAGCRCFQHSCGCTTGWQPEPLVPMPPTPEVSDVS